jgi:hypothetical protein
MKKNQSKCQWQECGKEIPTIRKKTARYCCDEHSYEAKKERSNQRYHSLKQIPVEIKRNESILALFYFLTEAKKPVSYDDLDRKSFNWGIVEKEISSKNGSIWRVLGNYAYQIEPSTKMIMIWKIK